MTEKSGALVSDQRFQPTHWAAQVGLPFHDDLDVLVGARSALRRGALWNGLTATRGYSSQ